MINYEALRDHVTLHEDDEKLEDQRMLMAEDTHGVFACIKGGVVVNTIIIDTLDTETISLFKAQYDDLVLIQHPGAGSPGMGWRQSAPGQPLTPPPAPANLVAEPASIPPDGTTISTVTYTVAQEDPEPPTQVTFSVNGAQTTEPVTNGVATIEVTSQTPNDTVTVTAEGLTTTITVEA